MKRLIDGIVLAVQREASRTRTAHRAAHQFPGNNKDLLVGKRSATSCQLSVKNKENTEKVYIATFKSVALSRQGEGNFMGFQMYAG